MARVGIKNAPRNYMDTVSYDIFSGCDLGDLFTVKAALYQDRGRLNARHPDNGMSPLHVAAADGNAAIVAYLLSQEDIELFQTDKLGLLALDWARQNGHTRVRLKIAQSMNEKRPFVEP